LMTTAASRRSLDCSWLIICSSEPREPAWRAIAFSRALRWR
jgi:hypothetical protein